MTDILKINPADNVVVAIQPQAAGAVIEVDGQKITVLEDVPAGHKIAIKDLAEGENVKAFEGREYLLERQLKPEARRDIIEQLRKVGIKPTAMMDISDGLSSEIMHICQQSNCGCAIYEDKLPIDFQAAALAEEMNLNIVTCALNGGEDYELLFT